MVDENFISRNYPKKPQVMRVGGTFRVKNLSNKDKSVIGDKLRAKDPVINDLAKQGAVGVKIDGRLMTQEWADQLDLTKPHIKRDDGIEIVDTKKGRVVKKDGKILNKFENAPPLPSPVESPLTEKVSKKDYSVIPKVEKEVVPDRTAEEVKKGQKEATASMEAIKNREDHPTEEALNKLDFKELKKVGNKYNVKGRSYSGLIKDIVDAIKDLVS